MTKRHSIMNRLVIRDIRESLEDRGLETAMQAPKRMRMWHTPSTSVAKPPSALVATRPSALVATRPSALVATQSASVATPPSASVATPPSPSVATQPSASSATRPSALVATQLASVATPPSASVATRPSASAATRPSALVAIRLASVATPPSVSVATPPSASVATRPSALVATRPSTFVATRSASVETPLSTSVATTPSASVATPPSVLVATRPSALVARRPSALVATRPSALVATRPSTLVAIRLASVATPPSASVAIPPSALVATRPSSLVATQSASVATPPSASVATPPSVLVATRPSALVARRPSALVATRPSALVATRPSTLVAIRLASVATPPSASVAIPPSALVATRPSALVATQSASVATPPSASVATPPSATVATPPSASVATPPSVSVATRPSASVARRPSALVATRPSSLVATQSALVETRPSASVARQPSALVATPPSASVATRPSASVAIPPSPSVAITPASVATPSSASSSVPSQAKFVFRPRHLRDEGVTYRNNYGSEKDSDESDEEDAIVFSGIPKVFRNIMETPLDEDDFAAGDPAPAADPTPPGDSAPDDIPPTATDQPWSCYDFKWREFPDYPIPLESRRETFSESNVGPTTPRDDPYDIFVDIWDRQIMEHIASETNKYAQQVAAQMLENHNLHPRSRIGRWYDTTVDELYVYFGIILAMGIVVKSRMEEYWACASDVFCTPGFSAHMSIDRFLLLNKCLHFNDNDDMCALELDDSEAKIFKIQPILSHLNKKFQELYTPAQNIVLDESLLMWKGWLDISQLILNKAAHRGIKTYEICEPQTGYLWRFEVHAHKETPPQQTEDPLEASTPSIVLRLIKGLENKGYTLWMDSFYNSPCLARRLKSLGFDCVGTLRTDRKFVPQALHSLTKGDLPPGYIAGLTSGDVDVMVWRDINRVAMISTYHGNVQHTVRGSTKPILILDYNIMMGGVDKKDKLLAKHPVERRRTNAWYKKLFRRLLNVSVLNSYIIYYHSSPLSHRKFRINLVNSLLSKHSSPSLVLPAPIHIKPVDVSHRLAQFPMMSRQRRRRACTVCKKQVQTFCVGCEKTVCIEPCFVTIHSYT